MKKVFLRLGIIYSIFSIFSLSLFGGVLPDSLVRMDFGSYKTAKLLAVGDKILSFSGGLENPNFQMSKLAAIIHEKSSSLVNITTHSGELLVGRGRLFYDPILCVWVEAEKLMAGNYLLDIDLTLVRILSVEEIQLETPVDLYEFELEAPHSYFIIDSSGNSILTHNGFFTFLAALFGIKAAPAVVTTIPIVLKVSAPVVTKAAVIAAAQIIVVAAAAGTVVVGATVAVGKEIVHIGKEGMKAFEKASKGLIESPNKLRKHFKRQRKEAREKEREKERLRRRNNNNNNNNNNKNDDDGGPEIDYRDNSIDHIFNDKRNHLTKTPENIDCLRKVVNDNKNLAGNDVYKNNWYSKINKAGEQLYARVNEGKIVGGGKNATPRTFNKDTGFCNPKT